MSIYFIRMIELLSLHSLEEDYYIQGRFYTTSTQPIDIFWKINRSIAKHIHVYCDFDIKSRYRLSLKAQETPEGSTIAVVTKTHLTASQRFDFPISFVFAQQLKQLNHCPNPIHLLQLPYLLTAEQFEDLKQKETPKPSTRQEKPFDLSNLSAATIIQPKQLPQMTRPPDSPIFTYHASENSAIFTRVVQGSHAI